MEDILFSLKQYQAIITRLDKINDDVTSIKCRSKSDGNILDSHDVLILFHVSPRTLYRWRKTGRLPYSKIGNKIYYRADVILECFKVSSGAPIRNDHPPPIES